MPWQHGTAQILAKFICRLTSLAMGMRAGCATQVPSWPSLTSRSLSARTFSITACNQIISANTVSGKESTACKRRVKLSSLSARTFSITACNQIISANTVSGKESTACKRRVKLSSLSARTFSITACKQLIAVHIR